MENPEGYNDVQKFISKFGFVIAAFLVALVGKVSNEILMRRKLSWVAWCAIIGISLFWSCMAGMFCIYMGYGQIASFMIVGLSTLLGEKINIYVTQNYKMIFAKIIDIFTPSKK